MFTPIPKSAGLRGKPGVRPIGIEVPKGGWFAADVEIKQAVEAKADKYGDLGQSLMVAVNYVGMHCDNIDVMNALYGQESTIVSFADDGGFTQRDQRKPNGLWFRQKGPGNPGVSGIMIASGLKPNEHGHRDAGAVSQSVGQSSAHTLHLAASSVCRRSRGEASRTLIW
jgi:hypothetical protein